MSIDDINNETTEQTLESGSDGGPGIKEFLGLKDGPGNITQGKERRVTKAVERAIHKDLKHNKAHVAELFKEGDGKEELSGRRKRKILEDATNKQLDELIKNNDFGSEIELRSAIKEELKHIKVDYDYKEKNKETRKRETKTDEMTVSVGGLEDKHNNPENFHKANESLLERKGVKLLLTAAEAGLAIVNPVLGVASMVAAKEARNISRKAGDNFAGHYDENGNAVPEEPLSTKGIILNQRMLEGVDRKDNNILKEAAQGLEGVEKGTDIQKKAEELIKAKGKKQKE